MLKISSLDLIKFRNFQNESISIWNNLTIIAWQNSTWKSSILWWIWESCSYKWQIKTINNKDFKAKYSEVFRFCNKFDYKNKYELNVNYEENWIKKSKNIKTRYLQQTEWWPERYKLDFDWRWKAIHFPVIYLWLKRLIPLATENKIELKELSLNNDEKIKFSKISKNVLILRDDKIEAEQIKTTNKEFLAMETDKYSHLWNSAWQDNIWQIITSILSFERLSKENWYNWWILLIDEIESTLYPWAQINLINHLYKFSKKFNVQVIFTTHSLEIIEYVNDKFISQKYDITNNDVIINFLESFDWIIKNKINISLDEIKDKIKKQTSQKEKIVKVNVLCEDKLGELWCKNLVLWTELKEKLNIMWLWEKFWDWDLSKMAEAKHIFFKDIRFILDWDVKLKYKKSTPPRTAFLPWLERPENIFYSFLNWLSDKDEFFNNESHYTKDICFNWFIWISTKEEYKNWFKQNEKYFWRNYSKLFNKWKKENKVELENFISNLKMIIFY